MRVQALIDQFGLRNAAKTVIDDEGHRGLSDGEWQRVSIGINIIHDLIILFLNELTLDLDSISTFIVVKVLQRNTHCGEGSMASGLVTLRRLREGWEGRAAVVDGKEAPPPPTRNSNLFVRRGFSECSIECIPEEKRKKINRSRGSKYYMKKLQPDMSGISIDRSRNDELFQGFLTMLTLEAIPSSQTSNICLPCSSATPPSEWIPPSSFVKINYDTSWEANSESGVVGIVIKDGSGKQYTSSWKEDWSAAM
ncbi:hypothetical protein RHGRI_028135 [Rhododendron griersonianum]|uniref:Uncharacterized protein n=1 Tax=Rhododendron griersonianum TaxID=479676 RepID=A0AAV6IJC0_9ERIC|nr:hypothetical protein RHGRI_028135 [Rhododendron griersonianum]